jgi:NitT/TauT family transport system substrate-binding protein
VHALEGVSFDVREGEWCVFGLSLGLEQGMKLVSALEMGSFDAFDYAFRKGQAPTDLAGLKGKTIVLGSAGWQAICDPMFASKRIDPSSIKYVEAGNS